MSREDKRTLFVMVLTVVIAILLGYCIGVLHAVYHQEQVQKQERIKEERVVPCIGGTIDVYANGVHVYFYEGPIEILNDGKDGKPIEIVANGRDKRMKK